MKWETLSSKKIYENTWMQVTEDRVKTETGRMLTYGVVRKKPFALIVPWDGKRLTLVRQYRYPRGASPLEFPQGHYEHESIEETAQAELREETGLRAASLRQIGRLHIAAGFCSQECIVFLATDLTRGEAAREESEEDMEILAMTVDEFQNMLIQGNITDAPTVAAWGILQTKGLLS